MIKYIFIILFSIILVFPVISQESCSVTLRKAQKSYDDGIIEEVPGLLESCLKSGFTKEEKVDAYKLLILCNLYEDKIAEAEELMLTFLKTDPEYQINPSIDPAEFILLYNSYRTSEIFSIGITAGTNLSNPYSKEQFGVEDVNDQNTEYVNSGFGFVVGPKFSIGIIKDLKANVEILYGQKQFDYTTKIWDFTEVKTTETQTYIEIPVSISYYRFGNEYFRPFVELGTNISYLLSANSQTTRSYTDNSNEEITGSDLDVKNSRNSLLFGVLPGIGLEYKLPKGVLLANLRYNIPLNPLAKESERYANSDQVFKFYLIDDKMHLSNLYFSFSYMYPIYNHKKK